MHVIEVTVKKHLPDTRGQGLVKDIQDLGITTVTGANAADIYWLNAEVTESQLDLICRQLLAEPVTQDYRYYDPATDKQKYRTKNTHTIEVTNNPGVTDPTEDSILKAIRDLGILVKAVKTAKRYIIRGKLTKEQLDNISFRLLVNPVIHHVVTEEQYGFREPPQYKFKLHNVELLGANTTELADYRKAWGFFENEFASILDYYRKIGRNPTDAELETLAQTWSEHCVHKTFKGKIRIGEQFIDNLLKTYIIKSTDELNKPWCLSVFEDNAGVIDFNGSWALCFKVETHNHPSAVEPYGGAATGIGGVIRDPLGTGLGAKPILNTDVFCFGPPDLPYEKVPKGVLHPRRVFKGVRAGVADYGNRLGIPTLNGAVLFDERFVANPLVFCGTLGLMPADMAKRGQQKPGDRVVVIGGKTGRDGIHGVTFASVELTHASATSSISSVQVGNPIVEKKVIDVLMQARNQRLYSRITDCGGGGLSSAIGEMGEDTGVRVDLDKVPLKYAGLTYSEIWISESQERMLLAVPPANVQTLLDLCTSEGVEAAVIGEFTDDKHLKLYYQGNLVCDLTMQFLHKGRPQLEITGKWNRLHFTEPDFPQPYDIGSELLKLLGTWNTCSKEWVIRQYDHEVQGGNVLKPLVGRSNDGPGDASIIRPLLDSPAGAIIANGINTRYGEIDPYAMACSVIDEALRQIIAVGGNLHRVALLDNFCWGRVNRPEMVGALVRAVQACHDMALTYGTPFISGKDSLNNEFEYEGNIISIPHTLLISALGIMEDSGKAITMDFKQPGDLIYVIGNTFNELGGSEYYHLHGAKGNRVPQVNANKARELMERLSQATSSGLVRACHDCSEGGLGVALAEMAFSGSLGAIVELKNLPLGEPIERDDFILFAESNSRFVAEVDPANRNAFELLLNGVPYAAIGQVNDSLNLTVNGINNQPIFNLPVAELKEAWQRPLRW